MEEILSAVVDALTILFFIVLFVCYYISFDKCFRKNGESRIKLFFLTLITNPGVYFVSSLILVSVLIRTLFYGLFDYVKGQNAPSVIILLMEIVPVTVLQIVLMVLFVLIYSKFFGKWTKEPVIFLNLMFYSVFLLSLSMLGSDAQFSSAIIKNIVCIVGGVFSVFTLLLFYKLDVRALSKLTNEDTKADWKVFIIPPAIFVVIYNVYITISMLDDEATGQIAIMLMVFSFTIIILMIWAFYIITKNINATNEEIKAKNQIKTLSVEVMEALAHTIDAKDKYTNGHSVRVAKYSRMIAEKMGLDAETCENIYYMGLLHDIGKIGVPNEIINKPSRLTDEEYDTIKTHPGIGFDILSQINSRPDLAKGARWHHERYDGKGYPEKISGEDIPLEARIIAVADTYDAMTSNRSYRQYLPQETVRAEIEKNAGTQFDPEIAKYMIMIIDADKDYILHE